MIRRTYVLTTLALLTFLFLGIAAYNLWHWQQTVDQLNISVVPDSGVVAADILTTATPLALRLTIVETGITAVTARQLKAAKLPFSELSAETIQLTRAGAPVPFHVVGEGEDAALYFYAEAITDTMEAPAVYLLRPGVGLAMAQKQATPKEPGDPNAHFHYRWEKNENFLAEETGSELWLGPLLLAPRRWNLSLSDVQANGGPAHLSIRFWSSTEDKSDPDHHVEILLNGREMSSWYWDGISPQVVSVPLPADTLQPDYHNLLTINVPGDTEATGEAFYLDWIYLRYPGRLDGAQTPLSFSSDAAAIRIDNVVNPLLIFDVTNPQQPVVLTNYHYEDDQIEVAGRGSGGVYVALQASEAIRPKVSAAPQWQTPLQEAGRGGDYVVILADETGFEEALQPLLTYREEQGLQVTAVSLSQIYDEFSYGQQSPWAIRHFLAYAASAWQPAPRFVLLVGDATYDMHDLTKSKNHNLLPTAYVAMENGNFVASDAWFTSDAPQMAIGRFPVQTAMQLGALVQKTIAYETAENSMSSWNQRALLVADDEPKFDAVSDTLASHLDDSGYQIHKLYMTENDNIHYSLISALNQGVGLVNYVGHGSATMWGDEAVLESQDAETLDNGHRLPIFTTFTCSNGAFADPQTDSLAESLLWINEGGIVAAVVPSGRSRIEYQIAASDMFYGRLLNGEHSTIGEVLMATRVASGNTPEQDIMQSMNLLGDPALRLNMPQP